MHGCASNANVARELHDSLLRVKTYLVQDVDSGCFLKIKSVTDELRYHINQCTTEISN